MQTRSKTKDIYSLSPMQEGMFFHSMKEPDSTVYFTQVSYRLKGILVPETVQESFKVLVTRHDILRTAFVREGLNQVYQVVLNEREFDFKFLDGTATDDAEMMARVYKENDKNTPFRLDKDALIRLAIIKLSSDEFDFVWSYHHILMDGWCVSVLSNEFYEIYNAITENREPNLLEPVQYGKYIKWLEKQDKKASANHWNKYLNGLNKVSSIPSLLKHKTNDFSCQNDDLLFSLDKDTVIKLQKIASKHHSTISNVLQTVWGVMLAKYNDSQQAVFGAVVSGRPAVIDGVERIMGLFINAIPVRVDFDRKDSFVDLLKKIQQNALLCEPHHHFPLAEIQANTALKQNLIDHIFVFENYPINNLLKESVGTDATPQKSHWEVIAYEGFAQTSYNFNVNIAPIGNELFFRFDWNKNVYSREIIINLSEHFKNLVRQVIKDETVLIQDLSLLTEQEKEIILSHSTGETKSFTTCQTIADLFRKSAFENIHKVALVDNDNQWTYGELDKVTNDFAYYLQSELEVKPNDFVGVLHERSALAVICFIAIQKAGGVYVPIDTKNPQERIEFILENTRTNVLLTQSDFLFNIGNYYTGKIFATDLKLDTILTEKKPNFVTQELAYVIHTSGTTGIPKGVLIRQASIIDRILFHNEYLGLTSNEVVLQFASNSFDASLVEILMAFFAGGTLFVAADSLKHNLVLLAETIETEKVSVAILPPAYLKIFDKNPLSSLRTIISTGEAAKVDESLFYAQTKHFYNGYGPTETCIGATFHKIDLNLKQQYERRGVPIGKPFYNTTVLVLNSELEIVPTGVMGEIYVTGVGLSVGYLNQPDLTIEKFIKNPYARNNSETWLYKTGDLGFWNQENEIEYLGRIDEQVQLNGIRVEIAEIEKNLMKHPSISNAAVVAQRDEEENVYLIAYTVGDNVLTINEVRAFLGKTLPYHMLPNWIVNMDELPVTNNGKIDRKQLPVVDKKELKKLVEYVAPTNEIEETLINIWEKVLNRTEIGIIDNFFQVGGQSLKATQVVSRIYKELKVKVELNELFSNTTIQELAVLIQSKKAVTNTIIEALPQRPTYPLSFAQKRLWIIDQFTESKTIYNVPNVYEFEGILDFQRFSRSFNQLIDRHEILRTAFKIVDGEPVQEIISAQKVAFEVLFEDISAANEKESIINHQIEVFKNWEFDLSLAPLFIAKLLKVDNQKYIFLLTLHHIISDGWSMEVMIRDILAFYNKVDSQLKPLRIHYKDYAHWQNQLLAGDNENKLRNYWLQQFQNPVALHLPTDYQQLSKRNYGGNTQNQTFSEETVGKLQLLCQHEGVSSYMLLVAIVDILLYDYAKQTDITLGTVVTGRQNEDLEEQIGLYTNTVALRTKFSVEEPFINVLRKAKNVILGAFEHQNYPFEKLVEELNLETAKGKNPLFDVMITHQNIGSVMLSTQSEITGLKIIPRSVKLDTSRFDLIFGFVEVDKHLNLTIEYSTELFKDSFISAMFEKIKLLAQIVVENPQIIIADLNLNDALMDSLQPTETISDFDIDFF